MRYLPLFLLLTACQIEHEVDIPEVELQPLEIYFCVSGWLWEPDGNAATNELTGEQRTCSEAY